MLFLLFTIDNETEKEFIYNLYIKYYPIMKKKAYEITRDISVTDDLIHEAFIKLMNKISVLRTLDCCKQASYIVNTIKNISISYVRKRYAIKNKQIMGDDNDASETIPDTEITIEEAYIKKEQYKILALTMSKLSERDRNLLYNKYIFELSDKEISELMDIPVNNIRQYLVRARKRALKLLENENLIKKSED